MLETLTDGLFQMEIAHVWRCHLWTKQEGREHEAAVCREEVERMLGHYNTMYPKSHKYELGINNLNKDGQAITL